MMPRGYDSLAEYYRAHREEMELALAVGCTPLEARAELRRRAKARRTMCGTRAPAVGHHESDQSEPAPASQRAIGDWSAPWMMRD
jgi:hypothetical protein